MPPKFRKCLSPTSPSHSHLRHRQQGSNSAGGSGGGHRDGSHTRVGSSRRGSRASHSPDDDDHAERNPSSLIRGGFGMDRIIGGILSIGDPTAGAGDSFCDRLNSQITSFLLFFFAILITVQEHYINDPIYCWHPEHFTESHENYTNQICWVQNTYYLPFEEEIPQPEEPRDYLYYYQWVGFILITQAIAFTLPRVVWDVLSRISGVSVTTITGNFILGNIRGMKVRNDARGRFKYIPTDAAIECQRKPVFEEREKALRYMSIHLCNFLRQANVGSGAARHVTFKRSSWWTLRGNLLTIFYLFVKLLYIMNIIAQILMLDTLLGFKFHQLGWEVMTRMARKQEVSVLHRFPRSTMCDFVVRLMGNNHRYTVQCALPINLYAEMIFTVLWFWFVFVGVVTSISFCIWVWRVLYIPHSLRYVRANLIAMDTESDTKKLSTDVELFVRHFILRDGMLIIYLVSKNSSSLIAAELISGLWRHYLQILDGRRKKEITANLLRPDDVQTTTT